MQIIPAIDLKGGNVVRLTRGDYGQVKVYSADPVQVAARWAKQGAAALHVVDLDGALAGTPKNSGSVADIVKAVKIPVEMGGGLRSEESIKEAFASGVSKVVLGTKAAEEIDFIAGTIKRYNERIIVSIDSRDGLVMLQGWTRSSGLKAIDLAKKMERLGAFAVIYTDITVDGTLGGPNFDRLDDFLKDVGISVIVAGGISSLEDIKRLQGLNRRNLYGVIVGKALYEGAFDLKEARSLCLQKE